MYSVSATSASEIQAPSAAAEGLLDELRVRLPGHVWDIACALRELAGVRSHYKTTGAGGQDTVETIRSSRAAVAGQVVALERCAAEAEAIRAVLVAGEQATADALARERNLDLLARQAAHQLATTNIDDLAARAALLTGQLQQQLSPEQ